MAQPLADEQIAEEFVEDDFEDDFLEDDSENDFPEDDFEDDFSDDNFEEDFLEDETQLPSGPPRNVLSDPDELYETGFEDNPLNPVGDSLEMLIESQLNEDLWLAMMGDLPCLEPTQACIGELQEMAVDNNLALQIIDERIAMIEDRIDEARARNVRTVQLGIWEPALTRYLEYDAVEETGFFENVLTAISSPITAINEVLSLVGIPLFRGITRTNQDAQTRAIAIGDLQIQVAQIEQESRKAAEALREQVLLAMLDFDLERREFQIAQEIARRGTTRHRLLEIEYRFSDQIGTTAYLNSLSQLDQQKAQTYRAWAGLRSQLEKIKILVLGTEN